MQLNIKKTEYLGRGSQTDISVNGEELKKALDEYLGSVITSDGSNLSDAKARVNVAWTKWRQLTGILYDHRIPNHLKAKIYKTCTVALYGTECWPASEEHKHALNIMEM
ncbi:hypothetical protein R3I93_022988 [Phoxinus phoxinus]|uniref:Uncharacterized protein n=1 Tax=Phoxinus phoxinus TaxID=58324 RepID=A0AAN9GQZ4_9TELE